MRCEECSRKGFSSRGKRLYFCTLCGELRCEDHTIWVPAHLLVTHQAIPNLLMTKPIEGWYAFCTRPAHIPQGVSVWFGRGRREGRVVEDVLPVEKSSGLELFVMWETGTIEEGFERHYDTVEYELSCALSAVMRFVLHLFKTEDQPRIRLTRIHTLVFKSVAASKPLLFPVAFEDFAGELGESPPLEATLRYVCSRCGVVVCLNRQASFYDRNRFSRLARNPETIMPIDVTSSKREPLLRQIH